MFCAASPLHNPTPPPSLTKSPAPIGHSGGWHRALGASSPPCRNKPSESLPRLLHLLQGWSHRAASRATGARHQSAPDSRDCTTLLSLPSKPPLYWAHTYGPPSHRQSKKFFLVSIAPLLSPLITSATVARHPPALTHLLRRLWRSPSPWQTSWSQARRASSPPCRRTAPGRHLPPFGVSGCASP
jgi:hypothetical protein